jgi:hypothetical protein
MEVDDSISREVRAYLHIFKAVLLAYASQHILLAALLHFASKEQLIQDEVCLLEVEDDVKFADIAIVLVHLLNVSMDDLEGDQFIICRIASGDEKQRSIATIDDFAVCRDGS